MSELSMCVTFWNREYDTPPIYNTYIHHASMYTHSLMLQRIHIDMDWDLDVDME